MAKRFALAMLQRSVLNSKFALMLLMVMGATTLLLKVQLVKPANLRPPVALHQDQPLLNLTNFHLISSPDACHPKEEIKALVVITSHAGNMQGRKAWRNGLPTYVSSFFTKNKFYNVSNTNISK